MTARFVPNARIRAALPHVPPGILPDRHRTAYERGGTPTAADLRLIADAAGTSPAWLMTGRPAHHAPTALERTSP